MDYARLQYFERKPSMASIILQKLVSVNKVKHQQL